jgi:hypothetical protein
LSVLPCGTNWTSSLARIGAFAPLIVCCGCCCEGHGFGGEKGGAGPTGHRRPLASRRALSMLAPSLAEPWKTTHRFDVSRSDSAPGRGESPLGRVDRPFMAGVSPKIMFTSGQAHETAPAVTHRGICDCDWPDGVQAEVLRPCLHRGRCEGHSLGRFARRQRDPCQQFGISCLGAIVSSMSPDRQTASFEQEVHVYVIDSHGVGILANHRCRRAAPFLFPVSLFPCSSPTP